MRALFILVLLLATLADPAAAQPRTVRLSPTATVIVDRDPIEDTDYSSMSIRSVTGVPAELHVRCFGRYANAYVSYDDYEGSMLVLRFGSERPDSFPQIAGDPIKVWGEGAVRLVQNPPTGIASIPTEAIPRLRRGLQGGQRLVTRLDSGQGRYDTYFETAGTARGLDMLSCLAAPPPARPRVLGRSNSEYDYDSAAVVLDSAAAAAGLDRLRPVLDRSILPHVMVSLYVDAEGRVDSVTVIGPGEQADEERIIAYMRGLRFRPALREGQPVRSSVTLHLYRAENLPRRR
jgi:hypothetical protein